MYLFSSNETPNLEGLIAENVLLKLQFELRNEGEKLNSLVLIIIIIREAIELKKRGIMCLPTAYINKSNY